MSDDLYSYINDKWICNACNVRPEFLGEHRCFGSDGGRKCECSDDLCRLFREEVSWDEILGLDPKLAEEIFEKIDRHSDTVCGCIKRCIYDGGTGYGHKAAVEAGEKPKYEPLTWDGS